MKPLAASLGEDVEVIPMVKPTDKPTPRRNRTPAQSTPKSTAGKKKSVSIAEPPEGVKKDLTVKKKRGRPPGSRNKKKLEVVEDLKASLVS